MAKMQTVMMLIYQKELWVQNKKKGICVEKFNTSVPPKLMTASLAGCAQHLFLSLLTPAPSNFGEQMQVGRGESSRRGEETQKHTPTAVGT